MDFANFPLDVQKCHLTFESFTYNTDEVRMKWRPVAPVSMLREMMIAAKESETSESTTFNAKDNSEDLIGSLKPNVKLPDYTLVEIKSFVNVTVSG